jgi:hypothetical protein
VISVDVREQSSFGTIRAYTAFGGQQTTPNDVNSALYFTRSFVQFAGFTIGRAVSFFDFFSTDPYALLSNIRSNLGNTGATGIDVFAYTAQLGNGVSATLSAEDACAEIGGANNGTTQTGAGRKCLVVNTSVAAALAPGANTTANAGYRIPDIVGALRADQAWGSAQLMGGLHSVKASYYGLSTTTELQNNGHPDDKWGWAAGAGFQLKNFLGMQGDTLVLQANYSVGAISYLTGAGSGAVAGFSGGANGLGNSIAFGTANDGVFTSNGGTAATGSSIELTTGWTAGGAVEHHWNPQLKTSVYGGYNKYTYSDTAANYICNGSFSVGWGRGTKAGAAAPVLTGTSGSSLSSCDPNLSYWSVGTRTQWNPNSNLDLGVDVAWNRLNSANSGVFNSGTTNYGGRPAGAFNISNYDVITAAIRAQYNFLP